MMNRIAGILLMSCLSAHIAADIFIYTSADGQKLITDHPISQPDYELITEKKTLRNVGRIMANRTVDIPDDAQLQATINRVSKRFEIDPTLVQAIIRTESSFDPMALSRKGAAGLMQLSDETASRYKVLDSMSPEENINAGVKHLRALMTRYKGQLRLVLAAYNAGETTVSKYAGVPPYPETERYIKKVLTFHSQYWQLKYGDVAYPYQNLL
jgi:soluble lytic murein transglycosylase-like protein